MLLNIPRNYLQMLLLITSKFKRINLLLFPLKFSKKHKFSDIFCWSQGEYICLNSLNLLNASVALKSFEGNTGNRLILEYKIGDDP